jgi:hypothetical protein
MGKSFSLEFAAAAAGIATALTGFWATAEPRRLCCLLSGVAFLVDTRSPAKAHIFGPEGVFQAIHQVPESQLLLLCSPWQITALRGQQQLWRSPRVAPDGFTVHHISANTLHGAAAPGPEFSVDLSSGEVTF